MARSPRFKIYRDGEYVGCVKYLEDAAAIAGMTDGTQVRDGHSPSRILWCEGEEEFLAGDSWDDAADVMRERSDA